MVEVLKTPMNVSLSGLSNGIIGFTVRLLVKEPKLFVGLNFCLEGQLNSKPFNMYSNGSVELNFCYVLPRMRNICTVFF